MKKAELLLEVRCEELPARMLEPAVRQLGGRLFEELVARRLTPGKLVSGFTPRRLMLSLAGVPDHEPDREEMVQGPPVAVAFDAEGKPTRAAAGFAERCGVAVADLTRVTTPRGEYVAALQKTPGRATGEVLAEILPRLIADLSWAKTMRWGEGLGPWGRPLHGLVAVYGGEIVPFELFGVASGEETIGHPLHSPGSFKVRSLKDYRKKLQRRGVEVRWEKRRSVLRSAMRRRAAEAGGELVEDAALLDKLAAMCAVPGVVEGSFDEEYLRLPREVLITSLRDHQSALSVERDGELLPLFLTVMDRADDPEGRVRAGNEWVVAARLADAAFFYREDRKQPLAARRECLAHLSFHERLGDYLEKSERVAALCRLLGSQLAWEDDAEAAAEAAGLAKADLTTEMVKEFTSLEGVMGGIYARQDGEPEEVWRAIYEHYLPASVDDSIPGTRVGRILALADRVDTLVGILGLGLVPTGSKDPFGLRRAAQGIVRIALEGELPVDLDLVAAKAHQLYGDRLEWTGKQVIEIWRPFLHDRVRNLLGRAGYAHDEIEAALAAGATTLPDLAARVRALHDARDEHGFPSVVQSAKRIANILRDTQENELDVKLLTEDAEKRLHQAFVELKATVERADAEGSYEKALRAMAAFAPVLDRFFVEVLVMDEKPDLRNNRIALLQSIQRVLSRTARLTEMVVERQAEGEENGES